MGAAFILSWGDFVGEGCNGEVIAGLVAAAEEHGNLREDHHHDAGFGALVDLGQLERKVKEEFLFFLELAVDQ